MEVLLLLSSLLGHRFYNRVDIYLIEKKKKQIERCIILIDELKWYISLIIATKKKHCFGPRYSLKQKYKNLITSYNLEREDYEV